MRSEIMNDPAGVLIGELKNLQDIADCIKPSRADVPVLDGIDVYGETLSLNEAEAATISSMLIFKNDTICRPGLSALTRKGGTTLWKT